MRLGVTAGSIPAKLKDTKAKLVTRGGVIGIRVYFGLAPSNANHPATKRTSRKGRQFRKGRGYREGELTHIERMAKPVSITFASGNWDVIQGLLTWEILHVRDDATRAEYLTTLDAMKQKIIRENA